MKKNNTNGHDHGEEYHKFWFGFAVGSAFCGIAAMAVGTKQGRQFLKKSVDYMESIDGSSNQIHHLTETIQKFTQSLIDDTSSGKSASGIAQAVTAVVHEVTAHTETSPSEKTEKKESKSELSKKQDSNTLDSIIDKMRNFSVGKKSDTKFFKKPKK
jgi:hypothetical protein